MILPGSTIGILGGGQLGRMLGLAARRMGYRVLALAPEEDAPAAQVADAAIIGAYDDLDAVGRLARAADVVTFEFENVSAEAVAAAARHAPVRPGGDALYIAQHRIREKTFLADRGFPVTPFAPVRSHAELASAVERVGCPAVLKTASFGYDGKGQAVVRDAGGAEGAWSRLGRQECVLERLVDLEREISMIGARAPDGSRSRFGPFDNTHRHHILDVTTMPSRVDPRIAAQAVEITDAVLAALDFVGVLCIEFFVARSGALYINELAPRPHNSGHLTIEACRTSQFEQQLRAICGLPLGSPELLQPAAMANLLGDLWSAGEPDWRAALSVPGVNLHLYGKATARPGRKMGHLTMLASTPEEARTGVTAARAALARVPAPR